jgi:huntingtin-interacting protein 1-related protein
VDKDKAEHELVVNIKKATSPEETAPKQKHVRSAHVLLRSAVKGGGDLIMCPECIVYTWDYHSSMSFWSGLQVQPILADEVQTFKALIMVHKVLQEGHPVVSARFCRWCLWLT